MIRTESINQHKTYFLNETEQSEEYDLPRFHRRGINKQFSKVKNKNFSFYYVRKIVK